MSNIHVLFLTQNAELPVDIIEPLKRAGLEVTIKSSTSVGMPERVDLVVIELHQGHESTGIIEAQRKLLGSDIPFVYIMPESTNQVETDKVYCVSRPISATLLYELIQTILYKDDEDTLEVDASLAVAMIRNIEAFMLEIDATLARSDSAEFQRACHRMKTTYSLLPDAKLRESTERFLKFLDQPLQDAREFEAAALREQCRNSIAYLRKICADS